MTAAGRARRLDAANGASRGCVGRIETVVMAQTPEQLDRLTAYLDGQLSPEERAEVEALLERDPEARKLLDELRRTSELVGSLPRATAPTGFNDRLIERLERQALLGDESFAPTSGRRVLSWARGIAAAASIALVAAGGWWFWPRGEMGMNEPTLLATVERADAEKSMARSASPADEILKPAAPAESFDRDDAPADRAAGESREDVGKMGRIAMRSLLAESSSTAAPAAAAVAASQPTSRPAGQPASAPATSRPTSQPTTQESDRAE